MKSKYQMREGRDVERGLPVYSLEVRTGERTFGPLFANGAPVSYNNKDLAKQHLKVLKLREAHDLAAIELEQAIMTHNNGGTNKAADGGQEAAAA